MVAAAGTLPTEPALTPMIPNLDLPRRRLLLAGVSSLALLAAACSKKPKSNARTLGKEETILCLGDSLTFGFGAAEGASYPQQLQALTGQVVQNAGINGDTSNGALARLPALLQDNKPGLVLVSIGGNDLLRGVPLDSTRAALLQIVRDCAALSQVVLVGVPKPDAMSAAAGMLGDHPLYAEIAAETGVGLFADAWSYVLSREALRSDRIHANAEGYKLFAERLATWLREMKYIA